MVVVVVFKTWVLHTSRFETHPEYVTISPLEGYSAGVLKVGILHGHTPVSGQHVGWIRRYGYFGLIVNDESHACVVGNAIGPTTPYDTIMGSNRPNTHHATNCNQLQTKATHRTT